LSSEHFEPSVATARASRITRATKAMSKTAAAVLLASLGAADAASCEPVDSCQQLSDGLYCPVNDVTEHANINKDVAAISVLLSEDPPNYADAKSVYTDGQESSKGGGVMRTLEALAQKDMTSGGKYTNVYYSGNVDLYGTYADVWDSPIVHCFDATGFCESKSDNFRKYIINKGLIGVVGGYATYEMGAAVWKAEDGSLTDSGAAYAWDEAAAFFIGNIDPSFGDGITGSAPGNLYSPYEFSWKRDADFPDGTSAHTETPPIFNSGLEALRGTYVAQTVDDAQQAMYKVFAIAAIRSAIKYSSKATGNEKYVAEGAMYWRFGSGYIASVSSAVMTLVQEVDALFDLETVDTLNSSVPCMVRTKVEAMYADLNITCEMVGTWKDDDGSCDACDDGSATGTLSTGSSAYAEMCMAYTTTDAATETDGSADADAAAGVRSSIAVVALAVVAFVTAGRP